jgi:hypothetical protein
MAVAPNTYNFFGSLFCPIINVMSSPMGGADANLTNLDLWCFF